MKEDLLIDIYNENGELKSKNDFIKEMEKVYDKCTTKNTFTDSFSYLDFLTTSENHIDIKATYKTFNFLGRNFYLNDEIDSVTLDDFQQFVSFWNNVESIDQTPPEDTIPLTVYINSPGGDLNAALSIISIMNSSRIPINTHVYGSAWSGAFLIAICGMHRTAEENSTFLFHEGNAWYEQDAHKFIQFSDFYRNQLLQRLKQIVISKTKIDEADYLKHKNDDWWLTTEEALEYGIIDKIGMEVTLNENAK